MIAVVTPLGNIIECRDREEEARVRAWLAWMAEDKRRREYERRQRQLEDAARERRRPTPQEYLAYRVSRS
jgi:hypothetical protein